MSSFYALTILCAINLATSNPIQQRLAIPSCPIHGPSPVFQLLQHPTSQPTGQPTSNTYYPPCSKPNLLSLISPTQQCQNGQNTPSQRHQTSPSCQRSSNQCHSCQKTSDHANLVNNKGTAPLNQELGQYLVERLFSNPIFREVIQQNPGLAGTTDESNPNVINNYFIIPKDLCFNDGELRKELIICDGDTKVKRLGDGQIKEILKKIAEKSTRTVNLQNQPEIKRINDREHRERTVKKSNKTVSPNVENIHAASVPVRKKSNRNDVNKSSIANSLDTNTIKQSNNTNITSHGPSNSKKSKSQNQPTFLSDEYILNDFRKKFPHVSEDTAKKIIVQMKKQVKEQYSNPNYNSQTPLRYVIRKRPQNASNSKNNSKNRNCTQILEENTVNMVSKTVAENETTVLQNVTNDEPTENIVKEEQNINKPIKAEEIITTTTTIAPTPEKDFITVTDSPTSTYKPEILLESTTKLSINGHQNAVIPELGSEDLMPNIDENDLIDDIDYPDYYPDFIFDNHAYLLDESNDDKPDEIIQRSGRKADENYGGLINNGRHKVGHGRTGRKQRRKRPRGRNSNNKTSLIELTTEENMIILAEYANAENQVDEEIVFQIPPGLESPDFRTVQIIAINENDDSNEVYLDEHFEKFSTYSEIKDGETANPINEIRKVKMMKPKSLANSDVDVETIYANSKVVNYANLSQNSVYGTTVFPIDIVNDGETAIVLGHSFTEDDFI